jgi:hypothetical protein
VLWQLFIQPSLDAQVDRERCQLLDRASEEKLAHRAHAMLVEVPLEVAAKLMFVVVRQAAPRVVARHNAFFGRSVIEL